MIDNSIVGNLRINAPRIRPEIKPANKPGVDQEPLVLQYPADVPRNTYIMFGTEHDIRELFFGYYDGTRWMGTNVVGVSYDKANWGEVVGWCYVNRNVEPPK